MTNAVSQSSVDPSCGNPSTSGAPDSRPEATTIPPAPLARRSSGWSKTIINFWLDCTLLVTFVALWWVSAVLHLLFPAGIATRRWSLWGQSVVDWQNIQFTLLCVFTGGVMLHLMLHWSWIMGVVSTRLLGRKPGPDNGTHTLVGVGLLIALLHVVGIALLMARASMSHAQT